MQTMKLTVGMHINNGPTFTEIASEEVQVVRVNVQTAENGQPIHSVRSIDVLSAIASAPGAYFEADIKGRTIANEKDAGDLVEIAKKLRRTASQLVAKAKTIGDAE